MAISKGTVREMTLFSKSLGEEVGLIVYLPPTFSPLYKYHLVIAQDGRDYFNLGRIARAADELLEKKKIHQSIIVGIPYQDVNDRWEKYHPEGKNQNAYIRFLGEELVPFLDKEFPTYQMGLGRCLLGDSLAGTVSLLAALAYPHTFGKVIMQSPFVNDFVLHNLEEFQDPHLVEMYHVIGKNETEVETTKGETQDFITPNRQMHAVIQQKGFSCFYEEFDGNHRWTYWQPDVKRALSLMLGNE